MPTCDPLIAKYDVDFDLLQPQGYIASSSTYNLSSSENENATIQADNYSQLAETGIECQHNCYSTTRSMILWCESCQRITVYTKTSDLMSKRKWDS